jgi:hypothetical protein
MYDVYVEILILMNNDQLVFIYVYVCVCVIKG